MAVSIQIVPKRRSDRVLSRPLTARRLAVIERRVHSIASPTPTGFVDRALDLARSRPGTVIAWVLGLHLVVWTVLPMLVCPNLQLDLVEDLALGREWQLGYWKHPPLPWWVADLTYRATGRIEAVYLLGPLAAVACMYAVWRLAREVVSPLPALVAVLALEGIHFFNFSVVKFAHDQMQLPFWALTGWLTYRAIVDGRTRDWMLAGACLALAFWSKYAAFALAATIGLFLLVDPRARQSWRTPGPYLMGLVFLVVLGPNLWWLVQHDFQPFRYVDARAVTVARWYQYVWFPLRWTGSQVVTLLPALLLLAAFVSVSQRPKPTPDRFARSYVTALALGPFAVTTVVAAVLGRLPIAMWGYPLWCFAPLAVVMWCSPVSERRRLAGGVLAFGLVFVAMPLTYVATEVLEPLVRDRPKATQFPGRLLAETLTRQWRERTGMPLAYVGGAEGIGPGPGEFAANNVAVYSPDRPHVIVHGNPAKSAWIDMADVARRGAVLVWLPPPGQAGLPENLRATFPEAEPQPPLILPRLTLRKRQPVTVHYAFWLPRG
jgi:4-amino-4-deoxy-L-arabinose transferase-like glycosyltransferase